MTNKQIKLLENLINIPSPSGFEGNLADFIVKELRKYLKKSEIIVDFHNNVTAIIKGTSSKKIMIDAHLDEVGFMVSNIDSKGIISIQGVGGVCSSILSARPLNILTDKGIVNAVVDRKHCHLIEEESDEAIEKLKDAQVDIGIRGRKKVMSKVKIGDPVVYKPSFCKLRESYYTGYGCDDKAGCFMLLEIIKEIKKNGKKPIPTLIFTFSSQEEIGCKGAKELARKYKPDLFIEVDVTFATDYGEDMEKESGRCELEKGIVLYRGVNCHNNSIKLMSSISNHHNIKTQIQASCGNIGYSSDEVSSLNGGIKTLILGIPLRNMHAPVEIINLKDLKCGINLLTNYLISRKLGKILES